jgi:nitroreductase
VTGAVNLPAALTPVALLPIGYPLETVEPRSRRPLNEIVHLVK